MKKYKLLLLLILFSFKAYSQAPHLTGKVKFSTKKGTMNCEFTLTNIPAIEDYKIWLNTGLNIGSITNETGEIKYKYVKVYNDKSYEAFQYTLTPEDGSGKLLPKSLRFSYTGAFPVQSDTSHMYETGDFQGKIAFNGTSIRLAGQTAWYPILYDVKSDKVINAYTYSLTAINEDGGTIYLNGDIPKAGGSNTFSSALPVPMLLYAGDFSFLQQEDIYFINSRISAKERQLLCQLTTSMIDFYTKKMDIPYGSKITYMEAVPVTKYTGWLFVNYPTVALIGRQFTMQNLFKNSNILAVDTGWFSMISHELAHYYFGTVFTPNSDLRWVFLEGTDEYLSLQFVKDKFGKKAYQKKISNYLTATEGIQQLITINTLKSNTPLNDAYKYNYVPLLLTAIEREIGMKHMWKWLNLVANSKDKITDYAFFKSSFLTIGVSAKTYKTIEETFITSEKSKANLINEFKK